MEYEIGGKIISNDRVDRRIVQDFEDTECEDSTFRDKILFGDHKSHIQRPKNVCSGIKIPHSGIKYLCSELFSTLNIWL